MKIRDIMYETYGSLSSNKARSGLTILGIVIGIASVIAMLAIGQGAQNSISERIQSIGSNLIVIYPGSQRNVGSVVRMERGSAQTLTLDDANALTSVDGVGAVAPVVSGRYQITAKGTNTNTQTIGTVSAYQTIKNISVAYGDFISNQNVKNMQRVAVLGPTTRDDLFGENASIGDVVGKTIRINSLIFTVIGVVDSQGSTGTNSADDAVYIPISTAQKFLSGNTYVSTIQVRGDLYNSMMHSVIRIHQGEWR